MKNKLIRDNDAKEIKRIRKLLRDNGYLQSRVNPQTEAQRVKQEGQY